MLGTMGEHRQVSHKELAMTPQHPGFVPTTFPYHAVTLVASSPLSAPDTFCSSQLWIQWQAEHTTRAGAPRALLHTQSPLNVSNITYCPSGAPSILDTHSLPLGASAADPGRDDASRGGAGGTWTPRGLSMAAGQDTQGCAVVLPRWRRTAAAAAGLRTATQ